jgi:hypothetical protein
VPTWPRFTLKRPYGAFPAGAVFRRAPSSTGNGTRYLVNEVACTCPDYQHNGAICKHIRAVVLFEQRQQPAPKRASYGDLFPSCKDGCGDLADGLDGRCSKCASAVEWQARRDARSR